MSWLINTEDLRIFNEGRRRQMSAGLRSRPSGLEDYLFMLFHDSVDIQLEGRPPVRYPAGSIMITEPGIPHAYGRADCPWSHSWLRAGGNFIREQMAFYGIPVNSVFILRPPAPIEKHFIEMHQELHGWDNPEPVVVRNLFQNFIVGLQRALFASGRAEIAPPDLLKTRRYLEGNYQRRITLSELAAMANLSVPHFCSLFKKYFGVSAIGYQISLRLSIAATLLSDPDQRVSEVASAVGYDDPAHFSRLFRKEFGISPAAYRSSVRTAAEKNR